MVVICKICGKSCKNDRGLSIHFGHMHSIKRQPNEKYMILLEQRIKSLEIRIEEMQPKMNKICKPFVMPKMLIPNKNDNGDESKPPIGAHYGQNHGDLI